MEPIQISMSAVLYQENGIWICQGLEFDITARGENPVAATRRFDEKVAAELVMSFEIGDEKPLSGIRPAPRQFWTMFDQAKMLDIKLFGDDA